MTGRFRSTTGSPAASARWALFARLWPQALLLEDEEACTMLAIAAEKCPRHPSLVIWTKLAEAASWQISFPALELLEAVQVEESKDCLASAYAQCNLFSLYLEHRAQLKQEMEKPRGYGSVVTVTWDSSEDAFMGSVPSMPTTSTSGRPDALFCVLRQKQSNGEDVQGMIFEVSDETRLLSRSTLGGLSVISSILGSTQIELHGLAIHATVQARQRDAIQAVIRGSKTASFHPSIRGAIIEPWSKVMARPEAEAKLALGKELASQIPEVLKFALATTGEVIAPTGPAARLTEAQQVAIENARSRCISLVRGPPGTGKTHVAAAIAASVSTSLQEGMRVLAVTQSHAAAINLHKRLEAFGVEAARVGTTLRATEVVQQAVFQSVKQSWPDDEDVKLVVKTSESDENRQRFLDVKRHKELQQSQFAVMRKMARFARVVVMTNASSGNAGLLQGLGKVPFLVMDEAAQALEPGPLVPLSWGCAGLALVGDEKQLPATVLDRTALQRGLGVSLFERFVRDGIVTEGSGFVQLDEQRRMHPSISEFPSTAFYGGKLQNGLETLVRTPVSGFSWPVPGCHVCLVDCGHSAAPEASGRSHSNDKEANALIQVLTACLKDGDVVGHEVGIITGYSAQQAKLQNLIASLGPLGANIRVDTVDGFQGAERDLILASTVRSNYNVGFMRDPRRVNVMLTRARRGLIVFGDAETLSTEATTWGPWVKWIRARQALVPLEAILASSSSSTTIKGQAASTWQGCISDPHQDPRLPTLSNPVGKTQWPEPARQYADTLPSSTTLNQNSSTHLSTPISLSSSREGAISDQVAEIVKTDFAAAQTSTPDWLASPEEDTPTATDLTNTRESFSLPPPLPPNWAAFKDPSTGKEWYWNEKTDESTWQRPTQ